MKCVVLLGSFSIFLGCSNASTESGDVKVAEEALSASEHCDSIAEDDDIVNFGSVGTLNGVRYDHSQCRNAFLVNVTITNTTSQATVEWADAIPTTSDECARSETNSYVWRETTFGNPSNGGTYLGAKGAKGTWSNGACLIPVVPPQQFLSSFNEYRFAIQARVFNSPGGGPYTTRNVRMRVDPLSHGVGGAGPIP